MTETGEIPQLEVEGEAGLDWEDEPLAVVVYENRACHVTRDFADGTHRTLRTADGHVLGSYPAGERGYFQACQQANSSAGAARRPR